jgi:hypothetical protein
MVMGGSMDTVIHKLVIAELEEGEAVKVCRPDGVPICIISYKGDVRLSKYSILLEESGRL